MPHKHFSVLVKCLKEKNVRLIERKEDGGTGKKFVHCIADGFARMEEFQELRAELLFQVPKCKTTMEISSDILPR